MEIMKKIKRSIAILLSVVMLISTFPVQVLAYYAPEPETLSILNSNGKKVTIDEDWKTTFPYGTFAFATGDMVMDEGGDGKITVYRLGGTKGRATAYITYVPVAAEIEEGVKTYANAAGSKDVAIQVENPLPIAEYQPVGKDSDPLMSDVTIDINMETSEDDEVTTSSEISTEDEVTTDSVISTEDEITTGSEISTEDEVTTNSGILTDEVCLTVNVDADTYRWYILADGNWEMVSDATEKNFILDTEEFETYDFRCVYKLDALTYCTKSAKGVPYEMPEQEELEEIPADLDLNPEITYSQLPMDDPNEYAGYVFELTFAEDEWVKEIQVSSPEDEEAEADKFGMFTIVDCNGGSLYDAANTLLMHVVDNETPESSEIGFELTDIIMDKSSGSAYLTVKRTGGTQNVLSVDYATEDGTAVSGKDYSAANGTLMFYGDINEQVIEIPLVDDGKKTDEQVSFTVMLSNLKGDKDGNCILTETTSIISLFNTAESEAPNLATLLYDDDDDVIDVSGKVDEGVNTIAPTTDTITGQEVENTSEPVVATLTSESGSELDPLTYNYPNKLRFSRPYGYQDWEDWNYDVTKTGWSAGSRVGETGWKLESKGATSAILTIPDMNKLYSKFISSFSWDVNLGNTLYGLEYTYPWFRILRSNYSSYASVESEVTDKSTFWTTKISYTTSDYMNKSWNIADNVKYLQLGLSRHDCHNAKHNAKAELYRGRLQRRTLNNSLSLRVYTANDSGSGVGGVKTSPDGSASLNQATGVYNDMIPEVKIVSGKGGVNYSGKLYVGSEIEVKLKNTPSYFPATGDNSLDYAVYLTNSKGEIKASSTSSGNTHKLKLLWVGMTDADLNDNYTVNIVMTRKQKLKLDIRPSVERKLDNDGNMSANINPDKIDEAINEFWKNDRNDGNDVSITYGYSNLSNTPPHFTYNSNGIMSSGSFPVSNTGTANDAILIANNISNLQWINFNREPEDIIVYNGRAYAGNEKIWLDVSDLSLSDMTFRYYDKKYKTKPNVMTTEISDTYLYLDSNGNGRIDGYYNEYTGYFRLDELPEGKDELILYLEPGVDYDESVFSPIPVYGTVDDKTVVTGYHQYFLKTFYTMTPRCLTIPEGASTEDKAQVLPAFFADVTDPNTYSSLTPEQQDYRYIISGKGRYCMPTGENYDVINPEEYDRTSDNHIMYGAEASKPAFVDIPLGGDNNPPSITDDGTGFTWSPGFHGNLLYKFAETQPIYIPHSIAGDNIPVAEVENINSETGEVTFKEDNAVEKINGYLGSFGSYDTYTLCVQEQSYTTEEIAQANGISISDLGLLEHSEITEQPNLESVNLASSGCFPNADYLKQNKATGETDNPNLDMSDSGNEFGEFNLDLGVKLPTADIGITDYVTIILDEYEVGFSIGIPLGGYNSNGDAGAGGVGGGDKGEWSGPKKANAAKAEDMGKLKDFLKSPSKDTFKATDDSYTDAKDNGKMKSSSFSVDFSVSIAFLFKYNTVDNEYKFSQFSVAVAAALEFKYQYRLTPCPIVYVYVTVGISVEISTGMTVDRDTVEETDPVLPESDTKTLKKGETYTFDTKYKAFNVTFDGKLYINPLGDSAEDLNKGYIKSEGDEPVIVTLKKQDENDIPNTNIQITALEDTTLTKVARITDMRNDVYWNGFVISPEAFIEAGAGIGVEICKFEIFIKVNIGCQMVFGAYDKDDKTYDPFEFQEFEFALGLGFRVVLLVFSYEMDLISYSITYDSERAADERWVHSWAALGGMYGDDIGTLSATDSKGNKQTVHIRLPGSTVDTQTIYAPDDGDLSTLAYDPSDAKVPFQLSGYGSSGDAFKLVDGLITGYDYKVISVGEDNYLIYTMGRNAVNEVDYSMLVMSKLELTKIGDVDSYGLVHPDTGEKGGYLVLDDDGTGDLGFTAWVEDDTTNASIHATWVSYDSVSNAAPTYPKEPTNTTPVGILVNDDGTTSSAIMDQDNYTDTTLFSVLVEPTEPTTPAGIRPDTEVTEPEEDKPVAAPDFNDVGKYPSGEIDPDYIVDKDAYDTLIAAWEAYELQQEWNTYDTDKLAYDDAKEIYDAYNAWVTYYSTKDSVNAYYQTRAANAAKNTVIKNTSFTIGDDNFTDAKIVSGATGSHVFLPDSDGEGKAVFFAKAVHYSLEEETTASDKYDDYLNSAYPSDDVGSSDSIKEYRALYQKGIRDAYGKGTTLNVAVKTDGPEGTTAAAIYVTDSKPLGDGEILENIEIMESEENIYYLTYTTSKQVYMADNLITIRKLYLRKVTINGGSVTWSDQYLLRTLHDYDQNIKEVGVDKDGVYKGSTCVTKYNEPYFANLQFIYGKLGELTNGEEHTLPGETPEDFLLFEMNGSTYIIPANDLNTIIDEQKGTIYPFFSPKAVTNSDDNNSKGASTGRSEVTIGADGAGNIAAVYVAAVPNTINNALFLTKYDPNINSWGTGIMLAMNYMQVYEDAITDGLTAAETEKAFFDSATKGGMDQFIFSNLQIALGQKEDDEVTSSGIVTPAGINTLSETVTNELPSIDRDLAALYGLTDNELSLLSEDEWEDKIDTLSYDQIKVLGGETTSTQDTLLVITQGNLTYLKERVVSSGSAIIVPMSKEEAIDIFDDTKSNRKPGMGVYAISYGVGGQSIGEDNLTFVDYDFTTGSKLKSSVSFVNTGDVAIRGSEANPVDVELKINVPGVGDILLDKWIIKQNIVSGQKVELYGTADELSATLPTGSIFYITVSEDKDYIGEDAFSASTLIIDDNGISVSGTLIVEEKPELGFEHSYIKAVGLDDEGNTIIDIDFQVGNRGTKDATGTYVQFTYENGVDKQNRPIYESLDITGHNLEISKQEALETLNASTPGELTSGILRLYNAVDGDSIGINKGRTVTGTIKVSPECYKGLLTDSCNLQLEVFSDDDNTLKLNAGVITAEHGEYNSINNISTRQIEHKTYFVSADKVTLALGNTMRLPVSISTSTGKTPQITAIEMPDGNDNKRNLGILYFNGDDNFLNGSMTGTLVIAPSKEGSGIIHLMDTATNTVYAITYSVTPYTEGINIFNDNSLFTFYNDNKSEYNASQSGQSWDFRENIPEWGEDSNKDTPYLSNLAYASKGASFTFRTVGDSMSLYFKGTVKVESTFPGFIARTITAKGGKEYKDVYFGKNTTNYPHDVTITVISDDGVQFDRIKEKYSNGEAPTPSDDANSPHIYWSRSFPDVASIETGTNAVKLTCYVLDDIGLTSVTFNGQEPVLTKNDDGFWQFDVLVSENQTISVVAMDNSGNRTARTSTVNWFNQTVSAGAKADAPELSAEFQLKNGVSIGDSFVTKGEEAFLKVTADDTDTVTAKYITVKEDEGSSSLKFTELRPNESSRFPVVNNGYYQVTTTHDGIWSSKILYMSQMDTTLPVVTLSEMALSEQGEDGIRKLSWSVVKGGTSLSHISKVTINGLDMSFPEQQTRVAGNWPISFGGIYTLNGIDASGNNATASYTVNDYIIDISAENVLSLTHSWNQDRKNGSISIDSDKISGGMYDTVLSDQSHGIYHGSYEYALIPSEQGFSFDAVLAERSILEKYASDHPDALDMPEDELSAALDIKEEEEREAWLIELVKPENDALWTGNDIISDITPGLYTLYVRDEQDKENHKVIVSQLLTVNDEAVSFTSEVQVARSGKANGIITVTASGGILDKGTYQFAISPMEQENTPLVDVKDMSSNPDVTWQFSDIGSDSLETGILKDLKAGWYQVGVRAMGAPKDTMNNLFNLNNDVENAKKRLDDANSANSESAIIRASVSLVAEIRTAKQQWDNAIENADEMEAVYKGLIKNNNTDIQNKLDAWKLAEENVINNTITREAADEIKKIYDDAVDVYALNKAKSEASTELSNATLALTKAQTAYDDAASIAMVAAEQKYTTTPELWDNTSTQAVYVKNISKDSSTHFDYSVQGKAIVTFEQPIKKLNGTEQIKLINHNKNNAIIIKGRHLNVVIPPGTLSKGDDVMSMLLLYAHVPKDPTGYAVQCIKEDGEICIMPLCMIENGIISYIANCPGKYSIVYNEKTFDDVDSDFWGKDAISFVTTNEIFQGIGFNNFGPNMTMTRAMLVTVLGRLMNISESEYTERSFDDILEDAWYSACVQWALENGIVTGYGDGKFRPNDMITREQMCTIIVRFLTTQGFTLPENDKAVFSDADSISDWALEAVSYCQSIGLVEGVGDNCVNPSGQSTRASVATIFMRLIRGIMND